MSQSSALMQYSNKTTSGLFQLTIQGKVHHGKKVKAGALEAAGHTLRTQGRVNACYSATSLHVDSQGSQPKNGATHSSQVSLPQDNLPRVCPGPYVSGNSIFCQVNILTLMTTV